MEFVRYELLPFIVTFFAIIKYFIKRAKKTAPGLGRKNVIMIGKNYGLRINQTKDNNNTKPKKEKFSGLRKKANSPRR